MVRTLAMVPASWPGITIHVRFGRKGVWTNGDPYRWSIPPRGRVSGEILLQPILNMDELGSTLPRKALKAHEDFKIAADRGRPAGLHAPAVLTRSLCGRDYDQD